MERRLWRTNSQAIPNKYSKNVLQISNKKKLEREFVESLQNMLKAFILLGSSDETTILRNGLEYTTLRPNWQLITTFRIEFMGREGVEKYKSASKIFLLIFLDFWSYN